MTQRVDDAPQSVFLRTSYGLLSILHNYDLGRYLMPVHTSQASYRYCNYHPPQLCLHDLFA